MADNLTLKNELLEVIENLGLKKQHQEHHKLEFKDLMQFRIDKILLVCSFYDYYTIIEDGHLQEALFNEYFELNLYYAPHITRAYSGKTALKCLETEKYDLIISTLRLGDLELSDFAEKVKKKYPEIPLVLLASQSRELQLQIESGTLDKMDRIFIWTGDRRIFLAIVKVFEDKINAAVDCLQYGVTSIILVEDSPLFYSSYLPLIYTEVMKQTEKLIEEGSSTSEKLLRQRARPKILHAQTYEEAWNYFLTYRQSLLGIITDLKFRRNGILDEQAGLELIKQIQKETLHIPLVLQTSDSTVEKLAKDSGIYYLDKNSRTLLLELREFMKSNFGFGDFIFRMPDGTEIQRAANLRELRDKLRYVPNECLAYHSGNNHFSYWLIARTQFELAYKIRPLHLSNFDDINQLRQYLINEISIHLRDEHRGTISIFNRQDFNPDRVFEMIGEGSLGGKARGLAFIDKVLKEYLDNDYFPEVRVSIPRTIVLGTDVFDQFIHNNDLYQIASQNISDDQILRHFLHADLPPTILGDLREIVNKTNYPLAVRSSSLLEDAVYQPFAGVYATVMTPNSSNNEETRFHNLILAIKYVYASTYSKNAKNYIEATGNRLEEEKMGLIIQEAIGRRFGHYFYPHFAGVARSYNYYPFGKATPKDGVVNLALGLGKTIVDGGISLQYSPAYPTVHPQFGSQRDLFTKSQVKFYAIDLNSDTHIRVPSEDMHLSHLDFGIAEKHKTLTYIASTYSSQNDMVYEGVHREGPRILNFAPILKSEAIPLNDIINLLLKLSEAAMNCPVEIEFAVVLGKDNALPAEFRFLQVRPMVKQEGTVEIDLSNIPEDQIILKSDMALGNGIYHLKYVLFVKPDTFDKSKTRQIAKEIDNINKEMQRDKKSYMLIGPGRWGSSDPWLGIPVEFSCISASRVIVEMALPDMVVDPSQGSHFFQNMTSFKISYITLKRPDKDLIDFDWLNMQKTEYETNYIKVVSVDKEILVKVNGKTGEGVALKV
jgi:CheY-like chemotaxis protein